MIDISQIPVKRFYMLRHAESQANAAKIYSGMMDTPLTDKGRQEALAAAKVIEHLKIKPKVIIHSHLQRTVQTADPIQKSLNLETVEIEDWAEQHYGDWQGQPHDNVRHLRDAGVDPVNGETNDAFRLRVFNALKKTLSDYEEPLIVCHGGCFRALSQIYGGKIRGSKNATPHEFIPKNRKEQGFPWDIYTYDPETSQKSLLEGFYEDLVT